MEGPHLTRSGQWLRIVSASSLLVLAVGCHKRSPGVTILDTAFAQRPGLAISDTTRSGEYPDREVVFECGKAEFANWLAASQGYFEVNGLGMNEGDLIRNGVLEVIDQKKEWCWASGTLVKDGNYAVDIVTENLSAGRIRAKIRVSKL